MSNTTDSNKQQGEALKPCPFCGRRAGIDKFHRDDDPQPLFAATCEICPVKTYDQFSAEEAARIWNARSLPELVPVESVCIRDVLTAVSNLCDATQPFVGQRFKKQLQNTIRAIPYSRASLAAVEGDALFAAYNQAINDALAAIRGERVDDPYAAATFINAIARKCSSHRYVAQLKERTDAGSS